MIYVITANDTFQTWLTSTQQAIVVVNQFLQDGNINVNSVNANSINIIGSGTSLNVTNASFFGGNVTLNQNATILGTLTGIGSGVALNVTNSVYVGGNVSVNQNATILGSLSIGGNQNITGNSTIGGNITITSAATVSGLNVVPTILAAFAQANTVVSAFNQANSVNANLIIAWGTANGAYAKANATNAFANIFITSLNVGYSWTQAGNINFTANSTSNNIKMVAGTGLLFFSDTQNSSILITDCGTSNVANAANNLVNNMLNYFIPTGGIIQYAGATEPTGWLFCSGNGVSRTTYSNLFSIISTTYGTGDGSTTFNVPDLRGRLVVGRDNMGGSAATRVTALSGFNANVAGNTGGNQMVQLHNHPVIDPTHTHTPNDPNHAHSYTYEINSGAYNTNAGFIQSVDDNLAPLSTTSGTTASAGTGITIQASSTGITTNNYGSGGSQNMPPAMVMNFIIKT